MDLYKAHLKRITINSKGDSVHEMDWFVMFKGKRVELCRYV